MDINRMRRDALNLWVSDFLYGYKADPDASGDRKLLFAEMVAGEALKGPLPVGHRGVSQITPSALFQTGEQYAAKWNVPLTMMALSALITGCKDANQVQMMMTVTHKQFMHLKAVRQAEELLDCLFIVTIFHDSHPTQKYFDEMWNKQKLSPGQLGGETHRNLLDYLTAADFQ